MISNISVPTEIDIDSLFDESKNLIPELQIHDYKDELNRVLNDALAQIDEHQRVTFNPDDSCNFNDQNNDLASHKMIEPQEIPMKPLSPASLLSDDSHINSPNDLFSTNDIHIKDDHGMNIAKSISELEPQFSYDKEIQSLKLEIQKLQNENKSLKKSSENKSKAFDKSVKELKRSEITRLKLMEENRELKKIVTKLTINYDHVN